MTTPITAARNMFGFAVSVCPFIVTPQFYIPFAIGAAIYTARCALTKGNLFYNREATFLLSEMTSCGIGAAIAVSYPLAFVCTLACTLAFCGIENFITNKLSNNQLHNALQPLAWPFSNFITAGVILGFNTAACYAAPLLAISAIAGIFNCAKLYANKGQDSSAYIKAATMGIRSSCLLEPPFIETPILNLTDNVISVYNQLAR